MDKREKEFFDKLILTFKEEAKDHLLAISRELIVLESPLDDEKKQELIDRIFREAHSLKGAARAVNQKAIQDCCQSLENLFAEWKTHRIAPDKEIFNILYACLDGIEKEVVKSSDAPSPLASELLASVQQLDIALREALKNPPIQASSIRNEEKLSISDEIKPKDPHLLEEESGEPAKEAVQVQPKAELAKETKAAATLDAIALPTSDLLPHPLPSPKKTQAASQGRDETIRVSLLKLDRLFQQAEELLNLKLAARQQMSDLKALQQNLTLWNKKRGRWQPERELAALIESKNTQSLPEFVKRFNEVTQWQNQFIRSIEEHLHQLTKITSQDFRLVANVVDSLLEDAKQILMQPLDTLLEGFPRMVRDLAQTLDKEVRLECQGGDIEIDRRILEEMKDPLIHLIRNSIDHGIETPKERMAANKPKQGKILISASQISSNRMQLSLSDDGRGIQIAHIKSAAVKKGLLSAQECERLSDEEALKLIFHAGISTSLIITEISGRGLGLGIVSEKVDKLGGQLLIETKPGQGTEFRIILPLTMATFRGIHVKVAAQDFIMPTHHVQRVMRLPKEQIRMMEGKETIIMDGQVLPFVPLGQLLSLPKGQENFGDKFCTVIVIKALEKMIAFGVDRILGEQDVLVKGMGNQLLRIKNTMATTITEWGQVIPILNPQDLVKSAISGTLRFFPQQEKENEENAKKRILLAEDSITSRMLLKSILEAAGYEVRAAVDGAEALAIFKSEQIDLLLSDVEMPHMDGFTLSEKVRASDKGKELPIVLCTSLESNADRQHGIEVGANAYLEKSSFSQSNLLDVINKLL